MSRRAQPPEMAAFSFLNFFFTRRLIFITSRIILNESLRTRTFDSLWLIIFTGSSPTLYPSADAVIMTSKSKANPSVSQFEKILLPASPLKPLTPHCESDRRKPPRIPRMRIYAFEASLRMRVYPSYPSLLRLREPTTASLSAF